MTAPRRRIVPPAAATSSRPQAAPQRLAKLHRQLEQERAALARWMRRLKRAFHSMERLQQRIACIERQIARYQS
jgi:septal ring factor EnvC (AmiA/AmiB activator)